VKTRGWAIAFATLLGAPACALIAGIEEPKDRPDAGADGATTSDVVATDTGTGDTAPEAASDVTVDVASDAHPDVATDASGDAALDVFTLPDGCVDGGPEICNDGIDNDCNGATDCQDTACVTQGWACVPAIPGGWTFGPLSTTTLGCIAGYASQSYVTATGATPTCSCACTLGQSPQCGGATIPIQTGTDPSCNAGTQGYSTTGCNVIGASPAYIMGGPVSASGGTCSTQSNDAIPNVVVTNWYACQSSGPFGKGCSSAGEVCGWVGAGSKCVSAPGIQGCPAGYTSSSHALGSGYNDNRACTPACGGCDSTPTASCANATITFYSGSSCNGGAIPVTLDGNCNSTVEGALSYQYSATAQNPSCGTPSTQSATGSVTLNGTATGCCAN
jgi:hypothetical protein